MPETVETSLTLSTIRKGNSKMLKRTKGIIGAAFATIAMPSTVFAAPSTIQQGVDQTKQLLNQAFTWYTILFIAGAAIILGRSWWLIHSASDDQEEKAGKRSLKRSIVGIVGFAFIGAIIGTLKMTYGING